MTGTLCGTPSKSMLYYTSELKVPANHLNIYQEFIKSLNFLFENNINYKNIYLIISDSAYYTNRFVEKLKTSKLFSNILHVKCVAYKLHILCEKIRILCPKTYDYLSNFKKFFKPLKVKNSYKAITKLPLPPKIVKTRWGSFINTSYFHYQNFTKIKKFINNKNLNICNTYITRIKNNINCKAFKKELILINKYKFLSSYIKSLENPKISTLDAYELIEKTKSQTTNKILKQKLNNLFDIQNNNDLYILLEKIKSDKDLQFSPIVSSDVERSFSLQNNLLLIRPNITVNMLKKLLYSI